MLKLSMLMILVMNLCLVTLKRLENITLKKLTQVGLAKIIGVTFAFISSWESGKFELNMEIKKKLVALFNEIGMKLDD